MSNPWVHASFAAAFALAIAPACRLDVAWSGSFMCDEPPYACPDGYTCEYGLCVEPRPPGAPSSPGEGDAAPVDPSDAASADSADAGAAAVDGGAAPDAMTPASFEASFGERDEATVRVVTTDTYLAKDRRGTNFGGADEVDVDASPEHTGLLRFELASLSPALRCTRAELVVRFDHELEQGELQIFALREGWVEYEATWNRGSVGAPWSVDGALGVAHAPLPMGSVAPRNVGEFMIPLDPLQVEAWIQDPESNFGMAWLSTSVTGRGATFASSEASDPSARPLLRLQLSP